MSRPAAVHPLQPRFAQGVTGLICLEALLFGVPGAVLLALGLIALNLIGPRWSPLAWVFRAIARPPARLEPAAPVRFAQGIGVVLLGAAAVLLALGLPSVAWVLVGLVGGLALLAAITGVCVGCEAYRLLLRLRRSGGGPDARADLGLDGPGPWLVLLTAPGCARCGPAARELSREAGPRTVVQVDLARRPSAARLPVRSVPAALAVGTDGRVLAARAGRLAQEDMREVVGALRTPDGSGPAGGIGPLYSRSGQPAAETRQGQPPT